GFGGRCRQNAEVLLRQWQAPLRTSCPAAGRQGVRSGLLSPKAEAEARPLWEPAAGQFPLRSRVAAAALPMPRGSALPASAVLARCNCCAARETFPAAPPDRADRWGKLLLPQ